MKIFQLSIIAVLLSLTSCKKFLEVPPPTTKIDMSTVFASDATAIALMNGIYTKAAEPTANYLPSLSMNAGLSADELVSHGASSTADAFYNNALRSANFSLYWNDFYSYIYTANQMIEGLNGANNISEPVKIRLNGEARFFRAYFYFNLVNLFGDVPLVTSTSYETNYTLSRTPSTQIYQQIIQDLREAEELLGTDYLNADLKTASSDRLRPNRWAAAALLARAYLFTGDYNNAITESTKVIEQSSLYRLETLENAFLSTSQETIFALQPVSNSMNTYEGDSFILTTEPNYSQPVSLSDFVYEAFEPGDERKTSWVGTYTDPGTSITYHFPYKYKVRNAGDPTIPLTENEVILRLAEQYLIRAESNIRMARVQQGIADLNTIRGRSRSVATAIVPDPLPALSGTISTTDALRAVEHERQVELFTEFGDRWLTLKRLRGFTNASVSRADEVMPVVAVQKASVWNTSKQLYPLPNRELRRNSNLVQNPGY